MSLCCADFSGKKKQIICSVVEPFSKVRQVPDQAFHECFDFRYLLPWAYYSIAGGCIGRSIQSLVPLQDFCLEFVHMNEHGFPRPPNWNHPQPCYSMHVTSEVWVPQGMAHAALPNSTIQVRLRPHVSSPWTKGPSAMEGGPETSPNGCHTVEIHRMWPVKAMAQADYLVWIEQHGPLGLHVSFWVLSIGQS